MTTPHKQSLGYYYNYIHSASQLYWSARWLELNKSLDEKDKMVDELLIRRLRRDADRVMKQGIAGLEQEYKSPEEGMNMMQELIGEIVK